MDRNGRQPVNTSAVVNKAGVFGKNPRRKLHPQGEQSRIRRPDVLEVFIGGGKFRPVHVQGSENQNGRAIIVKPQRAPAP